MFNPSAIKNSDCCDIFEYLKTNNKIHVNQLMNILSQIISMYTNKIKCAVQDLVVPENGRLIILGDTHGQFNDVA